MPTLFVASPENSFNEAIVLNGLFGLTSGRLGKRITLRAELCKLKNPTTYEINTSIDLLGGLLLLENQLEQADSRCHGELHDLTYSRSGFICSFSSASDSEENP